MKLATERKSLIKQQISWCKNHCLYAT